MKKPNEPTTAIDLRWVIVALIVVALAATGVRALIAARHPPTDGSTWSVHLRLDLHANKRDNEVVLAVPADSPTSRLHGEKLALDGLRLHREKGVGTAPRIVASARGPGRAVLDAEFVIHLLPRTKPLRSKKVALTNDERRLYLSKEPGIDPQDPSVSAALETIAAANTQRHGLPGQILDYVRNHVRSSARGANRAVPALRSGRGDALGRARAMVAMCRSAGFPARTVTGFMLDGDGSVQPRPWVEVYNDGRWLGFDPTNGYEPPLPDTYLAFGHGTPIVSLRGMALEHADYYVRRRALPAGTANGHRDNPLSILNMSRLPFASRSMLATLLLLPLGALLNAFVKRVVGVQTYGTFTPALLALAAVYVDWMTAAVIFGVVAVIGLFGRSLLPRSPLTRSPRLTIVFTLIALAMGLSVSIMAYFDLASGAPVALLPIVILTTLVDRIYTVADQKGKVVCLVRLLWTSITAVGCFFILNLEDLGEILVSYPELHLITIALVFALVSYHGPVLLDYPPLRWLGEKRGKGEEDAVD